MSDIAPLYIPQSVGSSRKLFSPTNLNSDFRLVGISTNVKSNVVQMNSAFSILSIRQSMPIQISNRNLLHSTLFIHSPAAYNGTFVIHDCSMNPFMENLHGLRRVLLSNKVRKLFDLTFSSALTSMG